MTSYRFPWSKFGTVSVALGISILIGVLGFEFFVMNTWIDALYNTAMILSGMGLNSMPETIAGKIFTSIFSLYGGLFFFAAMGIFISDFLQQSRILPYDRNATI